MERPFGPMSMFKPSLLAILIELMTHHGDDDDERAHDEVDNVAAAHGPISLKSNSEHRQ
jgi:hypothetical protein